MSDFGAILDPIMAHVETAIAGITTERAIVPLSVMSDFPFAYGFMASAPADALDFLQESRGFAPTIVLVTNGETQEATYLKVDAIRAQLYTDRTLGGVVDRLHVFNVEPFEEPKPGTKKGATITIVAAREG